MAILSDDIVVFALQQALRRTNKVNILPADKPILHIFFQLKPVFYFVLINLTINFNGIEIKWICVILLSIVNLFFFPLDLVILFETLCTSAT